jgi:hypothetical protein
MTVSSPGKGVVSPSMGASSSSMPQDRDLVVMKLFIGKHPELVLDGVRVVRACFFQEPLEVVCGQSRLALGTARCLYSALHARVACSFIGATVVVGCDLLAALLVPLLVGLGSLLDSMDGDIGRRRPVVARGWSELGRLGADGMMGNDAAPFSVVLLGALVNVWKGYNSGPSHHVTSECPCQCPLEVTAAPSPQVGPVMTWVPCTPFGPRACPAVLPTHRGLTALLPQRSLGVKSVLEIWLG